MVDSKTQILETELPKVNYQWPNNKSFAFTIFDDTDNAKVEDVKAVYEHLISLNIFTTKSVWVTDPIEKPRIGGVTCSDESYRQLCQSLAEQGVEISLHNASSTSSDRSVTQFALEQFNNYFGHYPRSFANHAGNIENLYWGGARLSGFRRALFQLRSRSKFEGHLENSPYFWGDLAEMHVEYTRNFVFEDLNTGKCDPFTPYHDPTKPYVKHWFSSSNASNLAKFQDLVTPANLDRLERENGYSIIYTHFCSFAKNGIIDQKYQEIMENLADRNGWFVPVSDLLDHLQKVKGRHVISKRNLRKLENRWLRDKCKSRLRPILPW